ncbi:hypothetical protein CEXT_384741 [Caerostris extrusa]|uniref:Secreted protein n=1 Tax=Caerostris extrusa TaxID=172846 RepID=A0AAV4RSX4_CAEEX|nr:hypothetical protein CEXT_384741 [Caerostris extrusa]
MCCNLLKGRVLVSAIPHFSSITAVLCLSWVLRRWAAGLAFSPEVVSCSLGSLPPQNESLGDHHTDRLLRTFASASSSEVRHLLIIRDDATTSL